MWRWLAVFLVVCGSAFAQSVPNGGLSSGQIWTPGQWLNAWQSKQDVGTSCLLAGCAMTGDLSLPVAANLAAAGTNQSTATPLAGQINIVTSAPAGSGVIVPYKPGAVLRTFDQTSNAIIEYPPAGATIDGNTVNVGMSIPAGSHYAIVCYSPTACLSAN